MPQERWPPIYDASELAAQIEQLAREGRLSALFGSPTAGGSCCQGDILQLDAGVPVLDEQGRAVEIDEFKFWLVVGNTCDIERSDVEWTQVVPVTVLDRAPVPDLVAYRGSRRFYLPPWSEAAPLGAVADFLRPAALAKLAIGGVAPVVARMSQPGWVLLHSCLVRFLARDDGRFDE